MVFLELPFLTKDKICNCSRENSLLGKIVVGQIWGKNIFSNVSAENYMRFYRNVSSKEKNTVELDGVCGYVE